MRCDQSDLLLLLGTALARAATAAGASAFLRLELLETSLADLIAVSFPFPAQSGAAPKTARLVVPVLVLRHPWCASFRQVDLWEEMLHLLKVLENNLAGSVAGVRWCSFRRQAVEAIDSAWTPGQLARLPSHHFCRVGGLCNKVRMESCSVHLMSHIPIAFETGVVQHKGLLIDV